jgi:transcriptional regulator with XRE-family HTH domain
MLRTLREVRQDKGLTQSEVAVKVNCNIGNYSNWESHGSTPCLDDAILLERVLGERIKWPDNISEEEYKLAVNALNILMEHRYPLTMILNYSIQALREGAKLQSPSSFIRHYAKIVLEMDAEESDILMPPTYKSKNK